MTKRGLVFVVVLSMGASTSVAQSRVASSREDSAAAAASQREASADRVQEVIRLKHVPAHDVAKNISELLDHELRSRKEVLTLLPDPIGNQLLISASPSVFRTVVQLVTKIDVRPASVVIEAVIVEVDRTDKKAGASLVPDGRERTLSREAMTKLLDKLKKDPDTQILVCPSIVALDSQPAFIQVGQRVPTLRTSGTKSSPSKTVQYENVGLILGVTARVSDDNLVTMEIDLEKSEVSRQNSEVLGRPLIDVISVQTTVSAESGQSVILSSLTTESSSAVQELIMIVTPEIIRSSASSAQGKSKDL